MTAPRLRIAVQKSGRLSDRSIDLLRRCGIHFDIRKGRLVCPCRDFPLDLVLVRDDDIPEYVLDGVCDMGIVGKNVLVEKLGGEENDVSILKELGFGDCRLSLALPKDEPFDGPEDLAGKRIATSYPRTLQAFMADRDIEVDLFEISGSVEIAPSMGIADAICDLVSTGMTLRTNGLREVCTILESEAVLVRTRRTLDAGAEDLLARLLKRLDGVLKAEESKYIMMNAPESAIDAIREILPGLEEPTVMPLRGAETGVAIHAVATEEVFWETMERLKEAGARGILVVPIEKIID